MQGYTTVIRRLAISGLLTLGLAGCITPSIPIPPPEPTAMTFSVNAVEGFAQFQYRATDRFAYAVVYVFNDDQGRGIIDTARADGSVGPTPPFPAAAGDRIFVTFEVDDQSVSSCVRVREGTPTADDICE